MHCSKRHRYSITLSARASIIAAREPRFASHDVRHRTNHHLQITGFHAAGMSR
jgi:hypothetical protein